MEPMARAYCRALNLIAAAGYTAAKAPERQMTTLTPAGATAVTGDGRRANRRIRQMRMCRRRIPAPPAVYDITTRVVYLPMKKLEGIPVSASIWTIRVPSA